jgi:hypothetical protein
VENFSDGDRVRIIGPLDSVWLEDVGTVLACESGDPEWAVAVDLEDDGRQLFRVEQLEGSNSAASDPEEAIERDRRLRGSISGIRRRSLVSGAASRRKPERHALPPGWQTGGILANLMPPDVVPRRRVG